MSYVFNDFFYIYSTERAYADVQTLQGVGSQTYCYDVFKRFANCYKIWHNTISQNL